MSNPQLKRDWRSKTATVVQVFAVIAALSSAGFWFASALITTPTQYLLHVNRGVTPWDNPGSFAASSPDLVELGKQLAKQSNLNADAAICAAIYAFLEAVKILLT